MTNPTTKTIVATKNEYTLMSDGELIANKGTAEEYIAGYVMNPENLDEAIYEHECELNSLFAAAKAEFGL